MRRNDEQNAQIQAALQKFQRALDSVYGKKDENVEIKPCPHCGGPAVMNGGREPDGNASYRVKWVECLICGCRTRSYICDGAYGFFNTDAMIAGIWNNRAEDIRERSDAE